MKIDFDTLLTGVIGAVLTVVIGACGFALSQQLVPPPPAINFKSEDSKSINDVIGNQQIEIQMLLRIQNALTDIQRAQRERNIQSISPL